jgi:hypothetical protein
MIKEELVVIVDGHGGPNDDSIPVYSDNKAPRGSWAYDLSGKQLMFTNGMKFLRVAPPPHLTPEENVGNKFYNFKDNGAIDYARVWTVGADGHGEPTGPFWVENSKLSPNAVDPTPEPDPDPTPTGVVSYKIVGISFDNGVIVDLEKLE